MERVRGIVTVLVIAETMEGFVREAAPGWRVHRLAGARRGEWERFGVRQLADHVRGTGRHDRATEPGGLPLMTDGGIKIGMTPSHPGARSGGGADSRRVSSHAVGPC